MVHDLCHPHAESLSVPRGWELRDEREPTVGSGVDLRPHAGGTADAGVQLDLIGA